MAKDTKYHLRGARLEYMNENPENPLDLPVATQGGTVQEEVDRLTSKYRKGKLTDRQVSNRRTRLAKRLDNLSCYLWGGSAQ